jgi:hypothetical protein
MREEDLVKVAVYGVYISKIDGKLYPCTCPKKENHDDEWLEYIRFEEPLEIECRNSLECIKIIRMLFA